MTICRKFSAEFKAEAVALGERDAELMAKARGALPLRRRDFADACQNILRDLICT
jgi:hypothetical protein